MDRRAFFRSALQKGGETAVKLVDERLKKQSARWIRPPFAVDELEFILACTRCRACVEACPHQVIFLLPARVGNKFVGTPALDLMNKGCHLCADWPCVQACEADALKLPDQSSRSAADDQTLTASKSLPQALAIVEIDPQVCLPYNGPECGACLQSCPIDGALSEVMFRPEIDADLCCGCGLCREHCISDPKAINIHSVDAVAVHTAD